MNYNKNKQCYNFKEYNFDKPLLTNVDATYIVHLENNGRLRHIEEQLNHYYPSKKVFIVFNKGYKNCEKDLSEKNCIYDLIDANLNIIQHSIDNDYSTILILEDDFQFSDKILQQQHHEKLDLFVKEKQHNDYIYYLGAIPVLKSFCFSYHEKLLLSLGTHAVIISNSMKRKLLDNRESARDWDLYLNKNRTNRYIYYLPLCYQIFSETENSQIWGNSESFFGIPLSLLRDPGKFLLRSLELDKSPEPGFTITYYLSAFIFILLCLCFIYICYYLYNFLYKKH